MSVIVGFDQGEYTVTAGTRQIVLSELTFEPTVESLMYVFNITQDKTYFAQAESYAKDISIIPSGDNYILEYQDLSIFPVLEAGDKLHIQFGRKNNADFPLAVTVYDEGGVPASVDDSTETLQTITYEHHEIHAGSHYNYADYQKALGSGDTVEFVMTTPDTATWIHLVFSVQSSTGADLELFEGTAGVDGGTTIIPRNNNRNSANTSDVTLIKDPTSITTDGTRAAGYLVGANRNSGNISRDREYVLKQNTAYLVRITSTASSNVVSWDVEWYAHQNK